MSRQFLISKNKYVKFWKGKYRLLRSSLEGSLKIKPDKISNSEQPVWLGKMPQMSHYSCVFLRPLVELSYKVLTIFWASWPNNSLFSIKVQLCNQNLSFLIFFSVITIWVVLRFKSMALLCVKFPFTGESLYGGGVRWSVPFEIRGFCLLPAVLLSERAEQDPGSFSQSNLQGIAACRVPLAAGWDLPRGPPPIRLGGLWLSGTFSQTCAVQDAFNWPHSF